jgi:hypothetical protein
VATVASYTLEEIADELGIPVEDVFTVAEVELLDPGQYDADRETVSESGRAAILAHFHGGTDPDDEAAPA